jgi:hypothetical protein
VKQLSGEKKESAAPSKMPAGVAQVNNKGQLLCLLQR